MGEYVELPDYPSHHLPQCFTGLPPSQENPMNTHAAFLTGTEEGSKDERIAGGTEQWCAQVLAARLLIAPGRTGYVRPLTDAELT